MSTALVCLKNVCAGTHPRYLLKDINLEVLPGKHFAIIGKSGSGKSSLLKVFAGLQGISSGSIVCNFKSNGTSQKIAFVDARHHFKNRSNTTSLYYQQRYNSFDADDSPTVAEHLSGIIDSNLPGYWTMDKVVALLNIESIYDEALIKLSNGETKRLRLASALLKNPELLLLDQPLTGLDTGMRRSFNLLLNEISASGTTVIMATSPGEIPNIIDEVIVLEDGRIKQLATPANIKHTIFNEGRKVNVSDISSILKNKESTDHKWVIKMTNVNVRYGDKDILKNITWEVKQGQHWALLGHNGAGKSTLLSLIYGDNPQAYANDIILFDKKRGSGESIWDIKKKCGFVSPELLQYFPVDNNCLQVVESGFYDTLGLFRQSEPSRAAQAFKWMEVLKIARYRYQYLKNIPASAQRLCLLARALVKIPGLLILDEPCQGMDEEQKNLFKNIINCICEQSNLTLIYVTHYIEELPEVVNHFLKLERGEVVNY